MDIGAHLPLIPLSDGAPSLPRLRAYAATASRLGYRWLSANDHLVFRRPWLDGLTALAAVLDVSGDLTLATTVCLPAVRGPVQAAKALAAVDLLSGGRLVAGLGPGSSARDYRVGGVPTEDRFARFEEAVRALRALLGRDREPFAGRFYSTVGVTLEPPPAQPGGPPVWLAGWGGSRGLRRAAELGDGWLASGYNTTPEGFAAAWARVRYHVGARGADPDRFGNGVATLWAYVTEDRTVAERILADVLAPLLGRPVESLRGLSLPIGPAEVCAQRLSAFAEAGAQRVLVWPLGDDLRQLELLAVRVVPRIRAGAPTTPPGG